MAAQVGLAGVPVTIWVGTGRLEDVARGIVTAHARNRHVLSSPVAFERYGAAVPTTISQRELRNDNADVMRRVEAGETFVVTRNGVPVADLLPHRSAERRRFVAVTDVAAAFDELGSWGLSEFEREQAELDRAVDDDDVDPWALDRRRRL